MAKTKAEKANLLPWLLQEALFLACQSLDRYFDNSIQFEAAFGSSYDQVAASQLLSAFAQGNLDSLPEIKILSNTVLGATNGAFAAQKNEIYLNERFLLANAYHIQAIANVLIEEIGHFIDAKINTVDSAGDEGEIFAKLVEGDSISQQELLVLKCEADTSMIVLDGEKISIEQNKTTERLSRGDNLKRIQAQDALAAISNIDSWPVKVAVLDSNILMSQEYFEYKTTGWSDACEVDNEGNLIPNASGTEHGIAVTGLIAGRNKINGTIIGVYPDAELLGFNLRDGTKNVRVLDNLDYLIKGITFAIENKAQVINLSQDIPFMDISNYEGETISTNEIIYTSFNGLKIKDLEQRYQKLFQLFDILLSNNIILVKSAGNDNWEITEKNSFVAYYAASGKQNKAASRGVV